MCVCVWCLVTLDLQSIIQSAEWKIITFIVWGWWFTSLAMSVHFTASQRHLFLLLETTTFLETTTKLMIFICIVALEGSRILATVMLIISHTMSRWGLINQKQRFVFCAVSVKPCTGYWCAGEYLSFESQKDVTLSTWRTKKEDKIYSSSFYPQQLLW